MRIDKEYYLKEKGGAALVTLIDGVDAEFGNRPDVKQAGNAFADYISKNPDKIKSLNDQLEKDPQLAGNIKALLNNNPAAFEKALPGIFANPNQTSQLIAAAATPAAAPVAAPGNNIPQYLRRPEPIQTVPAQTTAPEHQVTRFERPAAPAPQANSTQAPAASGNASFNAKMDQLSKMDGFNDLMDSIENNPAAKNAMKSIMDSNGAASNREEVVDALLEESKSNKNFLKDLAKTIKDNKGSTSSLSSMIEDNPVMAIKAVGMKSSLLGGLDTMDSVLGGLGNMNLGSMFGSMGTSAAGLFGGGGGSGGFMGMIQSLMSHIRNFVGNLFGGSTALMVGADTTNGRLTVDGMIATNSKAETVTTVDTSNQTQNLAADEYRRRIEAGGPAAVQPGNSLGTSAPSAQV